jgi:hypothetical protein
LCYTWHLKENIVLKYHLLHSAVQACIIGMVVAFLVMFNPHDPVSNIEVKIYFVNLSAAQTFYLYFCFFTFPEFYNMNFARGPIMFVYFLELGSVIFSFISVQSLVAKHCQIFHQKPVRVLSLDLFVNSKPREWPLHIFA